MKKVKNISVFVFAMLMLVFFHIKTEAYTRTISSIRMRVNSNVEIGEDIRDISIGLGNNDDYDISLSLIDNSRYNIVSAEVLNQANKKVRIGDDIKIRLKLEARSTDSVNYRFSSQYSKSNFSISGAEYISSNKRGDNLFVNLKVKPARGKYEEPEDPRFTNNYGEATWEEPRVGTGYYDLIIYRNGTQIASIKEYNDNYIDLSSYMTKKGRYSFKVRTVAYTREQKLAGLNSDYEYSDDFYLEDDDIENTYVPDPNRVINGKVNSNPSINQRVPGSTKKIQPQVAWVKEGSYWYYKYPDGSYQKNSWGFINSKWYLFDNSGRMLTGWQLRDGKYYYLNNPNGDMHMGWLKYGDNWYYLNNTNDNLGAMLRSTWLKAADSKIYYLLDNGIMATNWTRIDNKWYYFYSDGHLARNEYIDGFYVDDKGVWIR